MQQFEITSEPVRQSKHDSSEDEDGESESGGSKQNRIPMNSGEVLKHEAKKSGKTAKSGHVKPVKSGILNSGVLGRIEEDVEDPFLSEDLPERFKQEKLDAATILQWLSLCHLGSSSLQPHSPVLNRKDGMGFASMEVDCYGFDFYIWTVVLWLGN
ncbi:hypothetical protein MRB53_022538 [Persea americana]|uniref:Uncharacterized protein n=1 Tax=Persea americana TaxID=3435 RepID=A0ACC2L788_PERAE|nr:hypothetical protein MRB53_022538 [Persea americana]